MQQHGDAQRFDGAGPSQLNLLTRAAQVNASNQMPQAPTMDMTC